MNNQCCVLIQENCPLNYVTEVKSYAQFPQSKIEKNSNSYVTGTNTVYPSFSDYISKLLVETIGPIFAQLKTCGMPLNVSLSELRSGKYFTLLCHGRYHIIQIEMTKSFSK